MTPKTFTADTPPQSGWYFATNNPDDPTNQVLGWWDATRRTFTTLDAETPAIIDSPPWVTEWVYVEPGHWNDPSCGGMWRGPEQWYGPIEPSWSQAPEVRA